MKNVPDQFIDRWDVLDELLCFGWTDGLRRKLDDNRTMQLISPRRQQAWALTDRARRTPSSPLAGTYREPKHRRRGALEQHPPSLNRSDATAADKVACRLNM
jgi:hypothetical protein